MQWAVVNAETQNYSKNREQEKWARRCRQTICNNALLLKAQETLGKKEQNDPMSQRFARSGVKAGPWDVAWGCKQQADDRHDLDALYTGIKPVIYGN